MTIVSKIKAVSVFESATEAIKSEKKYTSKGCKNAPKKIRIKRKIAKDLLYSQIIF